MKRRARGFTLIELLVVIAMVGVLAALATVGYRRYLHASRSGDAKAVLSAIRISEESYKAETMVYLDCNGGSLTTPGEWYPLPDPNGQKRNWRNPGHVFWNNWRQLNVTTDSPTTFAFAVVAGAPGVNPPGSACLAAAVCAADPAYPNPPAEPWYVVQAVGDQNNDDNNSYFLTSSFNGEIASANEEE